MTFYKNRYRIESHRKTGWDYSDDGWYFLTWVTRNRNPIFGEIQNKTMVLNPLGKIVETEILKSAIIRRKLIMDEYVIMPNHVHFLIGIHHNLDFNAVETHGRASENECDFNAVETHGRASQNKTDFPNETHGRVSLPETPIPIRLPRSVSSFVAGLKSAITTQINQYRQTPRQPLWQRNYHDRIIRSETEFYRVKQYIVDNPTRWETDCYNP